MTIDEMIEDCITMSDYKNEQIFRMLDRLKELIDLFDNYEESAKED